MKSMNKQYGVTGLLAAVALSSGCATMQQPPPTNYHATMPPAAYTPPPVDGSIYHAGYEVRLFEDIKARRLGDVITIMLEERTQASKSADLETSKETDTTLPNPTLLGSVTNFGVPGIFPLDSTNNNSLETSVDSTHEFTGEGEASQSNSLTGNISVTVSEILPNGNLVVRGEKWLTLNQGEEFIQVSGIVRPQDIKTDNTISSTLVADARITYSGKGMVADSSRAGWLSRFFNHPIWPF